MLAGLMRSLSTKGRGERQQLERQLQKVNGKTFYPRRAAKDREERQLQNCNGHTLSHGGHEGPRRTATAGRATAEGQRQNLLSAKGREERQLQNCNGKPFYPRRAAKNGNCNCRTATATPFSTEDTKGRGERQLQEGQLQKVNGKTFCPRRAAKNGNCRTATATPFSTEDTKGHGERQLRLLKVNGKHLCPRRAAKDHGERQLQNCNGFTFLFAEDTFGAADYGCRLWA